MDSNKPRQPGAEGAMYGRSDVLWRVVTPTERAGDSLVARVYEMLWKQIVEGERRPGERLIDGELAEMLGVSRTPVRQALYQLQQAGLVAGHARGFYVAIDGPDELRELFDLRAILESAAVRAAAGRIPHAELRVALADIGAPRQLHEPELGTRFLRSDIELHHHLIAMHAGNRRLAEAIAQQHARLSVFVVAGTRLPRGILRALDEHEIIVRALLANDTDGAAAAMERHIQRVRDDALTLLPAARPFRVARP